MSGQATRWLSDSYTTWIGPPKGVELVELLNGTRGSRIGNNLWGRTRAGW